ncbi:methyltransferase domain-containing protein [Halomontanus rarus]|uniref:methyltransferase domain-containing protein n=1 Tax=Halomontanus rarus TaxID=3034020 RepID=UPI001A98EEA7
MTDSDDRDRDDPDPDEDPIETNRAKWEEYAEIHPETEYYDVPGFVADDSRSTLQPPERELLGDLSGRSLVHLQCHIGLDTLSWARAGASVVGVDFATTAIETAREIRDEAGLTDDAEFVRCDVFDAPETLDREFDVVFASYGVLCWIPDVDRWAEAAASLCRPGGTVFLADFHPILDVFEWDLTLRDDRSYFREESIRYEEEGTYADWDASVENAAAYEWQHGLGEIVTAFARAGLRVDTLREYPIANFRAFDSMIECGKNRYRIDGDPLPLVYALAATADGVHAP